MTPPETTILQPQREGVIRSGALFAIAAEWRRDAEMQRNSCRKQEKAGRRDKADRHYQRSLDLDACAKRIEDLAKRPR